MSECVTCEQAAKYMSIFKRKWLCIAINYCFIHKNVTENKKFVMTFHTLFEST
jgi:hypothetical protein